MNYRRSFELQLDLILYYRIRFCIAKEKFKACQNSWIIDNRMNFKFMTFLRYLLKFLKYPLGKTVK